MVDPFLPDADKVAALREALPATGAGLYLDTATAGPLPSEIVAAAREVEDWDVRTGRAGEGQRDETLQRLDETRAVLAALLGADPREVALTHGATAGIVAAALMMDWQAGERVLTVEGLGDGPMAALDGVAARMALQLDVLPDTADDDGDTALARLQEAIRPETRLVVLPHVEPRSGATWPLTRAAEAIHQRGAWLAVDGSYAAGAVPAEMGALDADAYAVDSHRWLLGPEGLGALWVGARFGSDARRFETGPFHRPSVVALGRAVGWLEMYVGVPWIQERTGRLAAALVERLASIDGVEVLTPVARLAAIVTFRIGGWTPAEALDELARRAFLIGATVSAPDGIRLSVGAFTTDDELARLADAVAELAGHTPATIPRRPTLVVLQQAAQVFGEPARREPSPGGETP